MRSAHDRNHSAASRSVEDHPLRRRVTPDNKGMRATTIFQPAPTDHVAPVESPPVADPGQVEADLHLVEPGRREQADPQQQRRAFQARCASLAHLLAATGRFEDRLELYRQRDFTRHELTTAAALYPELMPRLNDEWEWIAITLADNLD